jgi:hypothetical protein
LFPLIILKNVTLTFSSFRQENWFWAAEVLKQLKHNYYFPAKILLDMVLEGLEALFCSTDI